MESAAHTIGINGFAMQLIKYKARRLIGQAGYTSEDQRDIEQDLVLDLLQRIPEYNSAKAQLNTFVTRVVDNKVASLIEARSTCKRDYRVTIVSINETLTDENGDTFDRCDTISQEDFFFRINSSVRSEVEQHDLTLDLQTIIEQLPAEMKELCELLSQVNITEASRITGRPRKKLYESIRKIRRVFELNGMQ